MQHPIYFLIIALVFGSFVLGWKARILFESDEPESAAKYNELLMAVARKFPNETRHETALRYIQEKEREAYGGECKNAEQSNDWQHGNEL